MDKETLFSSGRKLQSQSIVDGLVCVRNCLAISGMSGREVENEARVV